MPVVLDGTAGSDVILATAPVVTAHPNFAGSPASLEVNALGGDDGIVRDRTGTYGGFDFQYWDAKIDGGAGFDVLNYNNADGPITARLDLTWTAVTVGGQRVYVQSDNGFSMVTGPALPIASENNWFRGADLVQNVEGIAGTIYDDTIHGDDKANRLWGHDGHDTVIGNGGSDKLWGGKGDDFVSGGDGFDTMDGGEGDDDLYGGRGRDTIDGGDGDDVVWGQQGDDTLRGGEGDDEIRGGDGNDRIFTGDGGDTVYGDGGRDWITVEGFGGKTINGGAGVDTLEFTQKAVVNLYSGFAWRGNAGVDGTDGVTSIENLVTSGHDDVVIATDGVNDVRTFGGSDWIMAMGGDDRIFAGAGDDTVLGGDGKDTIRGEDGADELDGGAGDDVIWGGHGADVIRGGAGADKLAGNQPLGLATQMAVTDVFVWGEGDIGLDTISDFSVAHDKLRFMPGFLAEGPTADNLLVFNNNGSAMLAANIAGVGWDFIANLEYVNAIALSNAIEDGSVFDVETTGVGDGAPGGFATVDLSDPSGIGLQILF
jgi:Ca2+-binding RTX toxin-like protein